MTRRTRLERLTQRTNAIENPWHTAEVWTNEPDGSDRYTSPAALDKILTYDEVTQRPGHKVIVAYDATKSPASTLPLPGRYVPVTLEFDRELEPIDVEPEPVEATEPEPAPVITIDTSTPEAPDPEPPPPEPDTATVDGVSRWLAEMHQKRARDRARMFRRF